MYATHPSTYAKYAAVVPTECNAKQLSIQSAFSHKMCDSLSETPPSNARSLIDSSEEQTGPVLPAAENGPTAAHFFAADASCIKCCARAAHHGRWILRVRLCVCVWVAGQCKMQIEKCQPPPTTQPPVSWWVTLAPLSIPVTMGHGKVDFLKSTLGHSFVDFIFYS